MVTIDVRMLPISPRCYCDCLARLFARSVYLSVLDPDLGELNWTNKRFGGTEEKDKKKKSKSWKTVKRRTSSHLSFLLVVAIFFMCLFTFDCRFGWLASDWRMIFLLFNLKFLCRTIFTNDEEVSARVLIALNKILKLFAFRLFNGSRWLYLDFNNYCD